MTYNGFFHVDRNSNILIKFKFNIYNVNDLSMNLLREYMFVDNVIFMRDRDNPYACWEAQNMELYSIEETGINEYMICDNTQDVRIRSCICVDKYTRIVTKRTDEYIDINCLEMDDNKNKIYKFINNKIYFTLFPSNELVETTWEEVFNIHPDTIEDFTLRDLSNEKGTPVEKAPVEKVLAEKAPVEKVPTEKVPTEKAPTEKVPIENPRVEKVPVSIPRQRSAHPNIPVKPKPPLQPHKLGQLNITR